MSPVAIVWPCPLAVDAYGRVIDMPGRQAVDMTTTLITGANKGLGFETARRLIEVGHTVYIGSRDAQRGRRAA